MAQIFVKPDLYPHEIQSRVAIRQGVGNSESSLARVIEDVS